MNLWSNWFGSEGPATATSAADRARLRQQVVRDEGCVLRAYRDSRGYLTVGVGHNLDADPALKTHLAARCGDDPKAIEITHEEADRLLANDLASAEDAVHDALPWTVTLDACRRGILIAMAFNCGIGGLLTFKRMLAALKVGQYARAADEMLDSEWAGQVGERATRLAHQMTTGEWT